MSFSVKDSPTSPTMQFAVKDSPASPKPDISALMSSLSVKANSVVNENASLRTEIAGLRSANSALWKQRSHLEDRVAKLEAALSKQQVKEEELTKFVHSLADIFNSASVNSQQPSSDTNTGFGKPSLFGTASSNGTTSFLASSITDTASGEKKESTSSLSFGTPFGSAPKYADSRQPPEAKKPLFSFKPDESSTKPPTQTDSKTPGFFFSNEGNHVRGTPDSPFGGVITSSPASKPQPVAERNETKNVNPFGEKYRENISTQTDFPTSFAGKTAFTSNVTEKDSSSLFPAPTPLTRGTFGLQPWPQMSTYCSFSKTPIDSGGEMLLSGSISSMPSFDNYSVEEIRLWDYVNGKRGPETWPLAAK